MLNDEIKKVITEIDWTKSVSIVNSVSFLSLALQEFDATYDKLDKLSASEIQTLRYSALLLSIAGFHYAILDVNKPSIESEMYIRYSDWILTTPLLLLVLGQFYNIPMETIKLWIVLDLIMIGGGIVYEKTDNLNYWAIGVVSYIALLGLLFKQLPEYDLLWRYFVIGWGFYGIIALLPVEQRFFWFNILDFYNKFVFAYDIRLRILNK